VARPTKYDKKLQEKADKYIENCRKKEQLATIEDLSVYLDINPDTAHEWKKIHDAFSETCKRIKGLQKSYLMKKGLSGDWVASMAIFLLKANHGLVDRQVVHNIDTPESRAEELLKAMGEDD